MSNETSISPTGPNPDLEYLDKLIGLDMATGEHHPGYINPLQESSVSNAELKKIVDGL